MKSVAAYERPDQEDGNAMLSFIAGVLAAFVVSTIVIVVLAIRAPVLEDKAAEQHIAARGKRRRVRAVEA